MSKEEIQKLQKEANAFFGALPDKMPGAENDTPELIALGKKLYNDVRLSVNDSQSCNTCHVVDQGGDDGKAVSPGAIEGKFGGRNANTVWNAGLQFVQFWDGRAANLEEQAVGPITNPVEMAMASHPDVEKKLNGIPEYKDEFAKVFKGENPVNMSNLAKAIAAFERTLISRDRFDDFQKGDEKALTAAELKGYQTFVQVGCTACHSGKLLGGHMYQKSGLVNPYENAKDLGRYEVTKNESDKYFFKVPTLRNIEVTGPYFHDGKVATLKEAVEKMAWMQTGKKLKPEEVESIVTFLKALTGKELTAK